MHAADRYKTDPRVQDTRKGVSHLRVGQGVLFASTHPATFDWTQWNPLLDDLSDDALGNVCAEKAGTITASFWALMESYLSRSFGYNDLLHENRKVWLQTGLALSPLLGTCAQHSVDVAWALDHSPKFAS